MPMFRLDWSAFKLIYLKKIFELRIEEYLKQLEGYLRRRPNDKNNLQP